MPSIAITTNDTNIVITIDKTAFAPESFAPEALHTLLRSITLQLADTSHIPVVDDEEQREIEALLGNPECHIYDDESVQA